MFSNSFTNQLIIVNYCFKKASRVICWICFTRAKLKERKRGRDLGAKGRKKG